ncbi:hypothetical protein VNO78_25647 [Psophocarpus tetragonolobus]|uniref:Uncharacterized protein n=1 Tax=Psophocarpus tetragonolobus TaxID=3891 RepID=A0AAN9XG01_PSOTE
MMGVTCDTEGKVTALDLSEESISGGFDNSSSLFSLQHLQKLNLAYNHFNSVIPSGFNRLENLSYLNLSGAGFLGQIPIEISQLTSITVPAHEWWRPLLSLHGLQELSMSWCKLSGPLDSSLGRFENLSVIVLNGNILSSPVPETFSHLNKSTILSLHNCNLIGTFPPKIFNIGTLSVLDISFNYNLNCFFPDFPLNGSLQTLRIGVTNINGGLPHSIGNMRHLSELDLYSCGFDGTIPNSLPNLTKLRSFPTSIFQLSTLSVLRLSSNRFYGLVNLNKLLELKSLTELDLSYNNLSININVTNAYPSFPNILTLNLASSNLTTFPSFLRNLYGPVQKFPTNLFTLDLHDNKFQGPIPIFPEQAMYMDFSSNKFDYFIAQDIGNYLSQMSFLSFANNTLNGSIPSSLCKASLLAALDLSNNKISGLIPSCFMNISNNLKVLNLNNNNLSGHIPDVVPTPCNLRTLNLRGNQLNGSIPRSLAYCSKLEVLDLGSNQIIGDFPCFLKEISTLPFASVYGSYQQMVVSIDGSVSYPLVFINELIN